MKDKEAESSAQVSKKKPSSLGEQNQWLDIHRKHAFKHLRYLFLSK